MCMHDLQPTQTAKCTTVAYKVVRRTHDNRFLSCIPPDLRSLQLGFSAPGDRFEYRLGETLSTPAGTPGFYLFAYEEDACYYARALARERGTFAVLKVDIPEGTTFREGRIFHLPFAFLGYLADTIKPVSRIPRS